MQDDSVGHSSCSSLYFLPILPYGLLSVVGHNSMQYFCNVFFFNSFVPLTCLYALWGILATFYSSFCFDGFLKANNRWICCLVSILAAISSSMLHFTSTVFLNNLILFSSSIMLVVKIPRTRVSLKSSMGAGCARNLLYRWQPSNLEIALRVALQKTNQSLFN